MGSQVLLHVLVVQHQHIIYALLDVGPPSQRMLKPAPIDHMAAEETLEKVVPGPLILPKDSLLFLILKVMLYLVTELRIIIRGVF